MDRDTSMERHFSVFRSAAEELETKLEEQAWDNEGGHMSSTAGRVVRTPGCDLPYKVVLTHDLGECSEHAFPAMREAEAFIRRNTPRPVPRCTLFDRAAGDGLNSKPLREASR